jgi:hypothetical protein
MNLITKKNHRQELINYRTGKMTELCSMVISVDKFLNEGYKIKYNFGQPLTYSKEIVIFCA